MKESAKPISEETGFSKADISEAILKNIVTAILGFAAAKASVKGVMLPFGLSFLAGMSRPFFASAATGAFAGYFFIVFGGSGFRYIAALFAILAIKLIVSPYKKISENPIFLSVITLFASAITNTLTLTNSPADILSFLCESFLAASGTYFICVTVKALSRQTAGLSANEMASLLITLSIFIMGLDKIKFYGVSLGKIAGVLLILLASKYGGTLSGAVSGIGISFAAALSGDYNTPFFSYSLGGLSSGIFAPFGRYAQCGAVLVSLIIDKSLSGFDGNLLKSFAEMAIGCFLFLTVPKSAGAYIGRIFSLSPKINENSGIKKALNLRLNMAAEALTQISETTEKVSKELSKISVPDFGRILLKIEEDSCKGCQNRTLCWETKRSSTVDSITEITKSLKGAECDTEKTELKSRCIRFPKICESTVKRYTEYASLVSGEKRISEVRDVVCSQFCGISEMLKGLSRDFEYEDNFNFAVAVNVASALKNLDICITETSAVTDKYGRTTATVKVKKTPELVLNKKNIMKICSKACELDFDAPVITESSNSIYIMLSEHAVFKTDIGVAQISARENSVSGDAYSYFSDGSGHQIMILSDGMGTGGRAAVDGAMAAELMTRLIKAGFTYDCALKLLNSSMLFKSSDESLATLDIASIDLYTGNVRFYKAGAAPTVIRRNGSCGKAESNSLPIGILENVRFDTAKIRLKENDIIVLLSDGATANGTDWIKSEIECFGGDSAQKLAEILCKTAKTRQNSDSNDDVTVMTAIIGKSI